jgi:phosphate transport system protein
MSQDYQTNFHAALDDLDDVFTEAGLRIGEEMPRVLRGFLVGSEDVIVDGRRLADEVAEMCREVEDRGFVLLARHQPVGRDLRRLVALLRMCVDVDRSAALLRHVPETIRVSDPTQFPGELRDQIDELATLSASVFRSGMDAWRTKDALAVNELDERDEQVDDLQRVVLETAAGPAVDADARVVIGLIARYLERIADHGVAIARDTAFVSTGERVTLPSKAS